MTVSVWLCSNRSLTPDSHIGPPSGLPLQRCRHPTSAGLGPSSACPPIRPHESSQATGLPRATSCLNMKDCFMAPNKLRLTALSCPFPCHTLKSLHPLRHGGFPQAFSLGIGLGWDTGSRKPTRALPPPGDLAVSSFREPPYPWAQSWQRQCRSPTPVIREPEQHSLQKSSTDVGLLPRWEAWPGMHAAPKLGKESAEHSICRSQTGEGK